MVLGSGCIDFDYKILEDLWGVKYLIMSFSLVFGKYINEYIYVVFVCLKMCGFI